VGRRILVDEVLPGKAYTAFTMRAGQMLRIEDVEGQQVADLVCFNLHDFTDRLNNENTMLLNHTWNPTKGHVLYSSNCHRMFTILEDTVGRNYPGGAMCSEELNFLRYGVRGTQNCRDNLAAALAPWGIPKHDLPGAFAPFMNVRHHPDGRAEIAEPTSRPGDYIELRAEMDLLVAISVCPQELNPVNAWKSTPLRVVVWEPDPADAG
jgi:uncharacterized protein YcgI (DUF1989 family)